MPPGMQPYLPGYITYLKAFQSIKSSSLIRGCQNVNYSGLKQLKLSMEHVLFIKILKI